MKGLQPSKPSAHTIQSAFSVLRDRSLLSSEPATVPTSPAITVTHPNRADDKVSLLIQEINTVT